MVATKNNFNGVKPSSADIRQEMYELQEMKREAAAAEKARIEAEQAHRKKIAEAEQRLAKLKLEAAEAEFNEKLPRNAVLLADSDKAVDELHKKLNELARQITGDLESHAEAISALFTDWWEYRGDAMLSIKPVIDDIMEVEKRQEQERTGHTSFNWIISEASRKYGSYEKQLRPVLNLYSAIFEYIAQTEEGSKERRVRQALGYALLGQIINPTQKVGREQLRDEFLRNIQKDRNSSIIGTS